MTDTAHEFFELQARGHAASCRLIKDVDGLYDRDPKAAGATRFEHASYEDCLHTDGSIIQFKAVRLAQRRALDFELGSIGRDDPTRIGDEESVKDLLDAIKATADFSFVTFSWNEAGQCIRIGFSTQSFYIPEGVGSDDD